MPSSIKPLDPEVIEKLQSGMAINSLARCVEELLLNSLDAGATRINIEVEPCNWKVRVIDNGTGMSFSDIVNVAERYYTSKCQSVDDLCNRKMFGYRGEALASIRSLCFSLEILSCNRTSSFQSHIKVFTKNVCSKLEIVTAKRPSSRGTEVTVYNLFYLTPVRRNSINVQTEFELTRRLVEATALIYPGVSFVLLNRDTGSRVFESFGKGTIVSNFEHLFGSKRKFCLKVFEFKAGDVEFNGCIGTRSANRNCFQFLYVNRRWLQKTKLHKVMNEMLGMSTFMNTSCRSKEFSPQVTFAESPHGIYVINISCSISQTDMELLKSSSVFTSADLLAIANGLRSGVLDFLTRENLLDKLSAACLQLESCHKTELHGRKDEQKSNKSQDPAGDVNERGIAKTDSYRRDISTANISKNLESRLVRRSRNVRKENMKSIQTQPPASPCEGVIMDAKVSKKKIAFKEQIRSHSSEAVEEGVSKNIVRLPAKDAEKFKLVTFPHGIPHELLTGTSRNLTTNDEKISNSESKIFQSHSKNSTLGNKGMRFSDEMLQQISKEKWVKKNSVSMNFRDYFKKSRNKDDVLKRVYPFEDDFSNSEVTKLKMKWTASCLDREGGSPDTARQGTVFVQDSSSSNCRYEASMDFAEEEKDLKVACSAEHEREKDLLRGHISSRDKSSVHSMSSLGTLGIEKESFASKTTVEGLLGMELSSHVILEQSSMSYFSASTDQGRRISRARLLGLQQTKMSFTEIIDIKTLEWKTRRKERIRCLLDHSDLQRNSFTFRNISFHAWGQFGDAPSGVVDVRRPSKDLTFLDSHQFTNEYISKLEVLCQVDRKFIACRRSRKSNESDSNSGTNLLLFVDQHAADERIQLEQLTQEALSDPDAKGQTLNRSFLNPSLSVDLDPDEIRTLNRFPEFFDSLGVKFGADGHRAGRVWLKSLPTCLMKDASMAKHHIIRSHVKMLIQEVIQQANDADLARPVLTAGILPGIIHRILCSQACHGAIKFGDVLTTETCKMLMKKLSVCQLPFQCAHGRPTIIPIADLDDIFNRFNCKELAKPKIWKLKSRNEH